MARELGERVKELECLYGLSKLVETSGISLEQILQGTAELIPPSWQYPKVTCARIVLGGQEFKTENFTETRWRQASDITAGGERIGRVEVCYLEERPESDEGPFLKEERDLIDAIAERLGSVTEGKRADEALGESETPRQTTASPYQQPYGNLVELNTSRVLVDAVGDDLLAEVVDDYLCLINSSTAIYEKNGDYSLGIFSSSWCRFLDQASRALCDTDDNREALRCGKWHCHESCWQASRDSMGNGQPADTECLGGIRLYAVPILAGGEIVGSINFGYGAPPANRERLREIAERYGVSVKELREKASSHRPASPLNVAIAKRHLQTVANLIGVATERKRAEQALERYTAELERSNAELEEFARVASHDMQEPLRMVASHVQLLQRRYEGKLGSDADESISYAVEGARRMQTLISDLLVYSRVGMGSKELAPADCVASFDVAVANLQEAIRESGARVTRDPLPTVMADASQFTQLLQNLIGNAIKFRSEKPPLIHVSAAREEDEWVFSVRDNGIGIDPQYQDRIFGIFQRLWSREKHPGTGLGLAICRKIVERYGGRIWVESEPGQGATFYFTIPRTGVDHRER